MTERWRKRLGDLDKQNPSEDLFERAKGGPQLPDEPISRPSTSTRVITGIAAFVVFALAISVFAIPALRLKGGDDFRGIASGVQLPLWPERTLEGIQRLQSEATAGNAAWALDPEQVATRFGSGVVGFSPVWAYEQNANIAGIIPCTGSSSSSGQSCTYDPYLGPSSSAASPFRTFELSQCGPNNAAEQTSCAYEYPGPAEVSVVLYQPFGSGIWAVREVHSAYLRLSASPGLAIRDQDSIDVEALQLPQGYRLDLGLHVGIDSCRVDETASDIGPTAPSASGNQGGFKFGRVGFTVGLDQSLTSGCSGEESGYVYATLADAPVSGDGFSTGSVVSDQQKPRLLAFAAVPITAVIPAAQTTGGASQSGSAGSELTWTTYTDPLGWTINVPSSWVTVPIDGSDGHLTYAGAAFGSARPQQYPGGPTTLGAAPGEVTIILYHAEGGPTPALADDSAFPLSFGDLKPEEGGRTLDFRASGLGFTISIRFADALTSEQQTILETMVSSILFEPSSTGDTRNGWTAVGKVLLASSAEWITYQGDHYVATYGEGRKLLGPAPACASGGGSYEVRETGVAGLSCPEGTGGDWDFTTGAPLPANSARFDTKLASYPAVRTNDGMLLVQFPQTGN